MNRQELEDAITHLRALLDSECCEERELQEWLEAHPVVFEVLGYTRALPHPELPLDEGRKLIPDFMAQGIDGLWDIIELKRPDTRLLKDPSRRTTFYQEMASYVAQCAEYAEHFNDSLARRDFSEIYGSPIQERPTALLVAGRNDGLDRQKVHKLLSRQIPHVVHQTFDDLLNQMEVSRSKLYGRNESAYGLSIHTMLVLEEPQERSGSYILDVGSDIDCNRVSLRTGRAGEIVLSVLDMDDIEHRAAIPQGPETFVYGQAVYLAVDVYAGPESVILVVINGRYVSELVLHDLSLDLTRQDVIPLVLGSDQTGIEPAAMLLGTLVIRNTPLSFQEYVQLRDWFYFKYEEIFLNPEKKPTGLEYLGHKYMYSTGHPRLAKDKRTEPTSDMMQEELDKRPIWKVSPDDPV